jgi:serine O-acetyltransferase
MYKIAVIGPESTGKSELCHALANNFGCEMVPEYARTYVEKLDRHYTYEDVCVIAEKQIEFEKYFEGNNSDGFVFFDTDLIITKIWFEYCYQQVPAFVEKQLQTGYFDLYLLCEPDLPWEADPVREHGTDRDYFFGLYRNEIEKLGKPYCLINGIDNLRTDNAINQIKSFFNINDMKKQDALETIQQLADVHSMTEICHKQLQNNPMPSTPVLAEIVNLTRAVLFPGYYGDAGVNSNTMLYHIGVNVDKLLSLLTKQIKAGLCFDEVSEDQVCENTDRIAGEKALNFINQLPEIRKKLYTDIIAAYNGDPAAKSFGEVIFCYPSIRAISSYRIANALLKDDVPLIPRIITEMAHSETGIDIHPGATIGEYFTIDHGTGVVIGETARIGNNVKMYQGVTLGAKSFPLDENGNPIKGIDRHPKIGNNVIIYSNSTILGTIKVGDGAVIGGNIWVDQDVPEGAKLVQRK